MLVHVFLWNQERWTCHEAV